MVALLAAFQFLTVLPAVIRRPFTPAELGRAVAWYPLVGLVLGAILVGLQAGLDLLLPEEVSAALLLIAWLILTRALHFDGFLDTCDGVFGGFTPERRLEIMRDSRVGAFGVAGGSLLLLTRYAAISTLQDPMTGLLLAPLLGRWAVSLVLVTFPYARSQGLGRDIKDHARWPQLVLAGAISLAAAGASAGTAGLAAVVVAALVALGGAGFLARWLPGLTGDTYGAVCETVETAILILFTSPVAIGLGH